MYLLYFVQTKQAKKKEQQSTAHIWNLNPDPQLSGMIVYLLQQGWSSKIKHILWFSSLRMISRCFFIGMLSGT